MKNKKLLTIITILLLVCTLALTACSGETESAENAHVHNWAEASCTAPKTCLDCKATEGEPLPHSLTCGYCSECNLITEAAMKKIDSATIGAVIIKWTLDYGSQVVVDTKYDSITFNNNIYTTKGTVICTSNDVDYVATFTVTINAESEENITLNKLEECSEFFEADENGEKIRYTFTEMQMFKHTRSGVVTSILSYNSDGTGTQYVYTYSGAPAGTNSYSYVMYKKPDGNYEIHTTSDSNGYQNINYYYVSPTEAIILGKDTYFPAY